MITHSWNTFLLAQTAGTPHRPGQSRSPAPVWQKVILDVRPAPGWRIQSSAILGCPGNRPRSGNSPEHIFQLDLRIMRKSTKQSKNTMKTKTSDLHGAYWGSFSDAGGSFYSLAGVAKVLAWVLDSLQNVKECQVLEFGEGSSTIIVCTDYCNSKK